ncbi:MAG: bifunctional nuclease family protein [Desulfotomaculaceae bacterium]|nr:bifunctional nuclease family protein [Desulfotomaculaceae bacterium]
MIPVKVREIAYDILMNPVLLLIDENELKALPIWIGPFEAHAIALALQGFSLDKPQTTDLLKALLDRLESRLSMVVINDVRDGTYYAELHIWHHGQQLVIDSRPSDAIALAIRAEAPIYLTEKVAQDSLAINELLSEELQEDIKELLSNKNFEDEKKALH